MTGLVEEEGWRRRKRRRMGFRELPPPVSPRTHIRIFTRFTKTPIQLNPAAKEQTPQLPSTEAHDPSTPQHQQVPAPCPSRPQPRPDGVFRGSDLVDWLVERGLCAGRAEAQLYGERLLRGGVLVQLTGLHSFRDEVTLWYQFTQGGGEGRSQDT
ncbi:unnamed protein product [Pleuronectes platessa]|uniref:DEP domain-containing protein n=1 Tax=Pleuronectes platessa TaxID=8262 RepID=A0A9N7TKH2_PLEPL|nr:unnamed protein product [Pleuronectes platessa]